MTQTIPGVVTRSRMLPQERGSDVVTRSGSRSGMPQEGSSGDSLLNAYERQIGDFVRGIERELQGIKKELPTLGPDKSAVIQEVRALQGALCGLCKRYTRAITSGKNLPEYPLTAAQQSIRESKVERLNILLKKTDRESKVERLNKLLKKTEKTIKHECVALRIKLEGHATEQLSVGVSRLPDDTKSPEDFKATVSAMIETMTSRKLAVTEESLTKRLYDPAHDGWGVSTFCGEIKNIYGGKYPPSGVVVVMELAKNKGLIGFCTFGPLTENACSISLGCTPDSFSFHSRDGITTCYSKGAQCPSDGLLEVYKDDTNGISLHSTRAGLAVNGDMSQVLNATGIDKSGLPLPNNGSEADIIDLGVYVLER